MEMKWIGAILILLSSGGFGFYLSAVHRRDEQMLRQLLSGLDYMLCELQYRLTPLPDLCRQAGRQCRGEIGKILIDLAEELESQIHPEVSGCLHTVLASSNSIPCRTLENLRQLGNSLGRFDLEGQISGLENMRRFCREDIAALQKKRVEHMKCYQTLGLCAGAALVILFI